VVVLPQQELVVSASPSENCGGPIGPHQSLTSPKHELSFQLLKMLVRLCSSQAYIINTCGKDKSVLNGRQQQRDDRDVTQS